LATVVNGACSSLNPLTWASWVMGMRKTSSRPSVFQVLGFPGPRFSRSSVFQVLGFNEGTGYLAVRQGTPSQVELLLASLTKEAFHFAAAVGEGGGLIKDR